MSGGSERGGSTRRTALPPPPLGAEDLLPSELPEGPRLTLELPPTQLALPGESPVEEEERPSQRPSEPLLGSQDAWERDRIERATGAPAPRRKSRRARRTPSAPQLASPPKLPESDGNALDLVGRRQPSRPAIDLTSEMTDRFALGDFTGALRIAQLVLGKQPEHVEAKRTAEKSRVKLAQLYESRIGPLTQVAHVAVRDASIRWLGLDHRAGFLLSRVDGVSTIEELIDISGMPKLEALKTIADLLDAAAIRLG